MKRWKKKETCKKCGESKPRAHLKAIGEWYSMEGLGAFFNLTWICRRICKS